MIISALLGLTLAAQGGQAGPFHWKEAVPAGSTVEVQGIIGRIRAVAAAGAEVEVTGTSQRGRRGEPSAVEIRVIREGSRITFCTIYPRDDRWDDRRDHRQAAKESCERAREDAPRVREGNDTRIDFEVRVPAGVNFVGQTVTEEVVLTGLRAGAEGYSVAGDVHISDVRGPVVDAASIGGDITFEQVDAAQVYAGTLSGDVRFTGTVKQGGDYSFLSYTGELTVDLPARSGVSLSVIAPRRGLHSSVELAPLSATTRRRFTGRQGNGSARMNLTTLNGEVVIRRAE
jgi:hypothetical protein